MEFLDISQYIINDILRLSIATFFHTLFLLCIFLLLIVLCFPFDKKKSAATATATATVPPIPPGKNGWPLVGESLEFLSSGWNGHPEKFFFDRMAAYSSAVFRTHLLGSKAAVFCGPTGNKFLFSNENTLVQAWWPSNVNKIFPTSIQTSNALGEVIKMRKMLPHFLKPEALHRHVGVMDATAGRHFAAGWENNDTVQVFPLAKNYTFSVACRIFVSVEDPTRVARLSGPFNALASGLLGVPIDLPGTPFRRGIKASKYIRKELVAMIKQRKIELAEGRVSASQDIMSHMLVTCDEDGKLMHELDIADKILGLLVGGHDTASSACTFVVKYLAELPHVYHAVYKEQMEIASCKGPDEALSWEDIQKMKYSWNVACEVLRLAPPLQGAFREAIKDFIYCGFSIPKGWKIYWSASSTHRNPECFPEPGKFEPSRFEGRGPAPYTYVPFGGGPRMCPGKEYARIEILVFMHHLVKRFRWEKLIPNEKVLFNPMPIPAKGLPIRLYPHILNCNHSSPTSFSLN